MEKLRLNKVSSYRSGVVLVDCLFGISIFLSTLFFAVGELSYFLKLTASLEKNNKELVEAVNTLHRFQHGDFSQSQGVTLTQVDPNLVRISYAIQPYSFQILVHL